MRPRRRGSAPTALAFLVLLLANLLAPATEARPVFGPNYSDVDPDRPLLYPQRTFYARGNSAAVPVKEPRKLVPATHPGVQFHTRWLRGDATDPNYYPFWTPPSFMGTRRTINSTENETILEGLGQTNDNNNSTSTTTDGEAPVVSSGFEDLAATYYWCSGTLSLTFTGTTSLSLHFVPGRRPYQVKWKMSPVPGTWDAAVIASSDFYLERDSLQVNETYEVTILLDSNCFHTNGFGFLGFGLDVDMDDTPSAAEALVPQPTEIPATFEFIGDSITWMSYLNTTSPSTQLLSFPQEVCRVFKARCSVVARYGMELIDYPPPFLSNLSRLGVGMEYGFFRRWAAMSSSTRFPEAPEWNFTQQGFVPKLVVISIGVNDRRGHIKPASQLREYFLERYVSFIRNIRAVYGNETKIVVMTPFGGKMVSNATSSGWEVFNIFTPGFYKSIADTASIGDPNVLFLNTTGWLEPDNVGRFLYDSVHPTAEGMAFLGPKVAQGLKDLGVEA